MWSLLQAVVAQFHESCPVASTRIWQAARHHKFFSTDVAAFECTWPFSTTSSIHLIVESPVTFRFPVRRRSDPHISLGAVEHATWPEQGRSGAETIPRQRRQRQGFSMKLSNVRVEVFVFGCSDSAHFCPEWSLGQTISPSCDKAFVVPSVFALVQSR